MTFVDTALEALSANAVSLSLHTADPGATGANETTAARQSITLVDGGGSLTETDITFTGGAASGPVTHVGFWDASEDFIDSIALAAGSDTTFNALGEYVVDSVTISAIRSA